MCIEYTTAKSLEKIFCYQILSGKLPPGARFPSIRKIAKEYHCAPNTAQCAVSNLKKQKLVKQCGRITHYVSSDCELIQHLRHAECLLLTNKLFQTLTALNLSKQEMEQLLHSRL